MNWPSWKGAKRVAVDIETCDLDLPKLGPGVRRGGYVVGVSYAIEGGPADYLPVRHAGGNLDEAKVWRYLADQSRTFSGELVGAGLKYDLDYLWQRALFGRCRYRDVTVAEPLLDEWRTSYSLDSVAEAWGVPGKDESELKEAVEALGVKKLKNDRHVKANIWQLHADKVRQYAVQDARLPLQLLRMQERKLAAQDLLPVWDLESRLLPALLRMSRRGVRVDLAQVDEIREWSEREKQLALVHIWKATGKWIASLRRAEDVAAPLRVVGVEPPLTPKTRQPSVTAEFLASVPHEVARLIERAKMFDKLDDFVKSVDKHAVGDRIHCSFNQLPVTRFDGKTGGVKFGRISCANPNLQQQPKRSKDIGRWREIYIPEDGEEWCSCDFSAQEPRMTVHFAEALGLPGGAEAAQRFRADPDIDPHQLTADMCDIERDLAKTIYLGLSYNMGQLTLCRRLRLPTAHARIRGVDREVAGSEAQHLFHKFHSGVPYVRAMGMYCEAKARQRGWIKLLLGRKCHLPSGWERKAMNVLIQGSSAYQTKKALVDADDEGLPLQLQVHDELVLSVADRRDGHRVAEIMRDAVELSVPSKVEAKFGKSWGKCK